MGRGRHEDPEEKATKNTKFGCRVVGVQGRGLQWRDTSEEAGPDTTGS